MFVQYVMTTTGFSNINICLRSDQGHRHMLDTLRSPTCSVECRSKVDSLLNEPNSSTIPTRPVPMFNGAKIACKDAFELSWLGLLLSVFKICSGAIRKY